MSVKLALSSFVSLEFIQTYVFRKASDNALNFDVVTYLSNILKKKKRFPVVHFLNLLLHVQSKTS